jgi:hypothetical protein
MQNVKYSPNLSGSKFRRRIQICRKVIKYKKCLRYAPSVKKKHARKSGPTLNT